MPAVIFFAGLDLEQKPSFPDRHYLVVPMSCQILPPHVLEEIFSSIPILKRLRTKDDPP